MTDFGSVAVRADPLVPVGRRVLTRGGVPVGVGRFGEPIGVEFDQVLMHPVDFAAFWRFVAARREVSGDGG